MTTHDTTYYIVAAGHFEHDGEINYKYISDAYHNYTEALADYNSVRDWPYAVIEAYHNGKFLGTFPNMKEMNQHERR